jgi:hypothetical protein
MSASICMWSHIYDPDEEVGQVALKGLQHHLSFS